MGRRGPGALPQVEKREQYARLIAQGFNNSEACRIVGINRRTGKRWRHGRTVTTRDGRKLHYAAVVTTGAVRDGPGRSPSTISRELRRNRDPVQRPVPAVHRAQAGRSAAGPAPGGQDSPRRGAAPGRGGPAGEAGEG